MSFISSRSSWLNCFRTCIYCRSTFSTSRWLRGYRLFSCTSRRSFCMSFFTGSRVSWLSSFRTSIHSWSTCFSITCSRVSWSFCMSCFTSRWLFSCTSRRSFCMIFRTRSYYRLFSSTWCRSYRSFCMSAFFASSRVSWSYGGTFTFGCTMGRSFSMSFTSGWLLSVSSFTSSWICRLFCMSFTSCWVIRLSFIMFRLLCFTVFVCINDIFT